MQYFCKEEKYFFFINNLELGLLIYIFPPRQICYHPLSYLAFGGTFSKRLCIVLSDKNASLIVLTFIINDSTKLLAFFIRFVANISWLYFSLIHKDCYHHVFNYTSWYIDIFCEFSHKRQSYLKYIFGDYYEYLIISYNLWMPYKSLDTEITLYAVLDDHPFDKYSEHATKPLSSTWHAKLVLITSVFTVHFGHYLPVIFYIVTMKYFDNIVSFTI